MELQHKVENNICIICEGKDFFSLDAEKYKTAIEILRQDTIKGCLLNMEKVAQIDSSGIGAIVSYFKKSKEQNKKFGICKMNKFMEESFKLTALDRIISLYPTEEKALESLS